MTHTTELQAGARAMYEKWPDMDYQQNPIPWDKFPPGHKERYCQAFAVGLEALLPVSDRALELAEIAYDEYAEQNGKPVFQADGIEAALTAHIKHITGAEHADN